LEGRALLPRIRYKHATKDLGLSGLETKVERAPAGGTPVQLKV
jgi:hypothetical protein